MAVTLKLSRSRWKIIVLAQFITLALVILTAGAQTAPVVPASQPPVSAAEVTAFMQKFQQDPNEMLRLESNPKRVSLLLGAIQREPAGPWVGLLQGLCFQAGRAATFGLPAAQSAQVSARAAEYLSVARTTVAKALEKDPRNALLKSELAKLEQSVELAKAESVPGAGTLRTRAAQPLARTNGARPNVGTDARSPAPVLRAQACASRLKQIDLAKQMWKEDNKKPDNVVPTITDLAYYFPPEQKFPKCPEGGTYTIGTLREKPRCSVAGHVLPKEK